MWVDMGLGYEYLYLYRNKEHNKEDAKFVLASWIKGSKLDSRELEANKIKIGKVNKTLVDYILDDDDRVSIKISTLRKLGNCIQALPCYIAIKKRQIEYNCIGFKLKELIKYLTITIQSISNQVNQLISNKVLYRDRYSLVYFFL